MGENLFGSVVALTAEVYISKQSFSEILVPYSVFIFSKSSLMGAWYRSTTLMVPRDSTGASLRVIPIDSVVLFISLDVYADTWSTVRYSGGPMYERIQIFLIHFQMPSVDLNGKKHAAV